MNSFDNFFCKKNALVVGGSGGIGKSISLMLAKSGANVTVHGGHASEKFDLLLREMNSISDSEFQTQKHRQIILDYAKIDLEKFEESMAFITKLKHEGAIGKIR
ncbi:MAG: SDR family NAD(P)-dependent oxidoreductase, partial [Treponemataceae bacterium]|nr:SDR family NAD(P)-dependent oxidoreductase [Treponemataceae bacterium]